MFDNSRSFSYLWQEKYSSCLFRQSHLILNSVSFRFKYFEVYHSLSSMRVGTDGVLLGAWSRLGRCAEDAETRVLDIGCGCGLIALMVAQRSISSEILGIDIDFPSIEEATRNAAISPFVSRVKFLQIDVRDFVSVPDGQSSSPLATRPFSLIVCNPPYYTEDTLSPDSRRSKARNVAHLSFAELLDAVCRLLAKDGIFSTVIPMQAREAFVAEAMSRQLHLSRECRVQTVPGKTSKRVLLEFCTSCPISPFPIETLVLQTPDGRRTPEYASLCADFYLW